MGIFAALATLAASSGGCGSVPDAGRDTGSPTLMVLLVVDQLRADLLDRYDHLFTSGLRALLDGGYRFTSATHDHANTYTATGHATLATGAYPARHGIVGNTWSVREGDGWRSVYAVEDLEAPILGFPDLPGRGPENILRPGLADWISSHDPGALVVSISRKDRSAITLASRSQGHVYWLADEGGEFVTSTAYRAEYPEWLVAFNRDIMPTVYADTLWESVVPREAAALTRPDSSRYEGGGASSAFPHRPGDLVDATSPTQLNHWRYEFTPFPDRAVVSLAVEALASLELGRRGSTDYLAVSLSQTDLVGHYFGPKSREQLDNLLRLDAEIGRFLSALDAAVGPGQWVLAFSADHGVLDVPEHLAEEGVDAERLTGDDRALLLAALDEALQGAASPTPEIVREAVRPLPFVAAAYPFEEIEAGQASDSFAALYANSHSRSRIVRFESRRGIHVRLRPNLLDWSVTLATTHGSPYHYDRHVPLIFFGRGVPASSSDERVATVDAAPTLARLAGIEFPGDLDGRVLPQVVGR